MMNTISSGNLARSTLPRIVGYGVTVAFVLVCSVAATYSTLGPNAVIDSLSDAGGGMINISWSLSSPAEDEEHIYEYPTKVCARWAVVEDGTRGDFTTDCFTEGMSTQSDFEVDTGLGVDGPRTEYTVLLRTYYDGRVLGPLDVDKGFRFVTVVLNASN